MSLLVQLYTGLVRISCDNLSKYDLIGDIHGHANDLIELLEHLDYKKVDGCYRHAERQVIFLGDFVDRGSNQRKVLDIVMPMVNQKTALAVMGNHELDRKSTGLNSSHVRISYAVFCLKKKRRGQRA